MTWMKVDDGFHSSPKLQSIPARHRFQAAGLWVIAGSWASQQMTDGFIPDYMIAMWKPTAKTVDALVSAGLWERVRDGFAFRSWCEYNPSKQQTMHEREASKARMRDSRERRKNKTAGQEVETPNVAPQHTNSDAAPRPDPTRPDPTRKNNYGGEAPEPPTTNEPPTKPKQATELRPDWAPSNDVHASVHESFPAVDLAYETEKFRDYWLSVGGARGRKKDWDRTWRSWIRKANEDLGNRGNRGRQAPQPRRQETIADWGASPEAADYFGLPWGDTPAETATYVDAEIVDITDRSIAS